jgi:thioesterase domain-containing protein
MFYRELVDALDPDQPVYGLQPEGLDGQAIPKTTIEEIAADYVRDVLAFRPVGPYLFAGYCYSGYIAFEIARQLHERGTPVAMLALIDTGPGLSRPTRVELERKKFRDFRERDVRGKAAWVAKRARGLSWKVGKRLRWSAYDILLYLRLPMPEPLRDLRQAGYRAWWQYRTKPAPVKLTLFRAVEAGRDWTRIALWSQAATGGVDVVPLHGAGISHDNLLQEPYVSTLALGLDQLIELALKEEALEPERPQQSVIA